MTSSHARNNPNKVDIEDSRWDEAYKPIGGLLREVERRLLKKESVEALAQLMSMIPGGGTIEESENYVIESGGKRLRAALCLLSASVCGADPRVAMPLAVAVELFHAATLVLDDLIEDADMRRGKPAVHRLWGDPGALATAFGLQLRSLPSFLESMLEASSAGGSGAPSKLVSLIGQMLARVLWGEFIQHRTRMNYDLHEDIYRRIISDKTAALFELCCAGGAIMAGGADGVLRAMEKYGRKLGLAFQISDDVLDLDGEKTRLGKSPGSDLMEGRVTLPLIFYFRDANDAQRLKLAKMLPPKRKPPLPRDEIVALLHQSGAIEQSKKAARTEAGKARRRLSRIPDCAAKESLRILATLAADRSR